MGILNSLKKLVTPQQEEKTEENIYKENLNIGYLISLK